MRTIDPARHAARRAQILSGAAAAFGRKGYDRTTVKDICASAGVGSGTLFHYFADKRAIFHAVLEDDRDRFVAALDALDRRDAPPAFWAVVELMTADLHDPLAGQMMLAILGQLAVDPAVADILSAGDAAAQPLLSELIARLQHAGDADARWEPAHAAAWVRTVIDGLYLRCGDDGFDAQAELERLHFVVARMLGLSARAYR